MKQRKFAPLLPAAAAFNDYPFPERSALWEARLALNAPELDLFYAAGEPMTAPLATPPVVAPMAAPAAEASSAAQAEGIALVAQRVRHGEVKAADVVAHALATARQNAHLNAFITLSEVHAPAEAERSDRRVAAGDDPGPLAGVPVAVKDLMRVAGLPLTGGSKALEATVSATDALAIARLRRAGAVVIGTTNLHELAYGITSDNPHFGRVGNPRGSDRIAGGSSGGSAAAVAAGVVAAAVGTDTAGSIRIPAACCGVVGFKPSYDAIPRAGVMNLAWSLDHVGPIGATVADVQILFAVMAGLPSGAISSRAALRGVRIVTPAGAFFERCDAAVARAVAAAITLTADDGAMVTRADIAGAELAPSIQFVTICCEATQEHWTLLKTRGERLGPDVRTRLEIGQFLFGIDYVKAQRLRCALRNTFLSALDGADVMALPTLRTTAPRAGAAQVNVDGVDMPLHTAMIGLTLLFNLAGLPAITLPCGNDPQGLPIGLQLVAGPGQDLHLLAIARRCETLLQFVR